MHACVSVVITVPHDAPAHVGVVTVRLRVPVRSQPSLNPPHAPQAPYATVPHDAPSVTRVHACVSAVTTVPHEPAEHVGVPTERLCVPDVAHVSAKPPHAPHAPRSTDPHASPSVTRVHVPCSVVGACAVQAPVPLHRLRVTWRVRVAVVAQAFAQLHADHGP